MHYRIRAQTEADIFDESHGTRHRTWAEAVEGYLDDGGEDRFLGRMFGHFDGLDLRRITPAKIRIAAAEEYAGCSNATINRQGIVPVQAVINWAHQQGWCGLIRVRRFPEQKADRRAVDADWIKEFISVAPPRLAALYLFMFTTGARISEAVQLTRADIDLREMTATLRNRKNGRDHTVSIATDLAEMIVALDEPERVFGYSSRHSVYGTIKTTCIQAGIDYVPPHQAGRHSFATRLDEAGVSPALIAQLGGWQSVRLVLENYTHREKDPAQAVRIMWKK